MRPTCFPAAMDEITSELPGIGRRTAARTDPELRGDAAADERRSHREEPYDAEKLPGGEAKLDEGGATARVNLRLQPVSRRGPRVREREACRSNAWMVRAVSDALEVRRRTPASTAGPGQAVWTEPSRWVR